jgi:glutathione S-transferase
MKLYHCPNTRSERVLWMFRELGVTPEIVTIELFKGQGRSPEYLARNPNGFVPLLEDGELQLIESSAILMHLADKFPEKNLAPKAGTPDRSRYYQYMVYSPAAIDPAVELVAYHTRVLPEAARVPGAAEYGKKRFSRIGKALSQMLGDRQFVVGNSFSAADIMVGSSLMWAGRYQLLGDLPTLAAYVDRLKARPALNNS